MECALSACGACLPRAPWNHWQAFYGGGDLHFPAKELCSDDLEEHPSPTLDGAASCLSLRSYGHDLPEPQHTDTNHDRCVSLRSAQPAPGSTRASPRAVLSRVAGPRNPGHDAP